MYSVIILIIQFDNEGFTMISNAMKNDLSKFNERFQQEKSKLNATLQNLDKFEDIAQSLLDSYDNDKNIYVKELYRMFYGDFGINIVELFLSNPYQAAFMFAVKFFVTIHKVKSFKTQYDYFKHIEDEMMEYLKLQNQSNEFIQSSCVWLKAQIKLFQGSTLGYQNNTSTYPLLDNFDAYFEAS